MSRAWRGGSTSAWRKVRALVLTHNLRPKSQGGNDGLCNLAIAGVCTGKATQVHHVLGKAVSGDDPDYLMAVCAECNRALGDPNKRDPPPQPRTKW